MADRDKKGRQARGERHHKAKLSEEKVEEMRKLRAEGRTFTSIAEAFGVSYASARSAINGETWKGLTATVQPPVAP